jgi:hypothetical protein
MFAVFGVVTQFHFAVFCSHVAHTTTLTTENCNAPAVRVFAMEATAIEDQQQSHSVFGNMLTQVVICEAKKCCCCLKHYILLLCSQPHLVC